MIKRKKKLKVKRIIIIVILFLLIKIEIIKRTVNALNLDIWDLSNINGNNINTHIKDKNKDKDNNEEDCAPNELLFIHGGHTSRVADFDWNPNQELTIASFADDNILQVWKMADKLYYED